MTDLGNAFYTAQTGKTEYARVVAEKTIEDFLGRLYSFPADSPCRKYMEEMRLSAITLGNGKVSRKREYTDAIENATRERDKQLDGLNGKNFFGKALENIESLAAGAGTFFITRGLLKYLDVDIPPEVETGASFAIGYTTTEAVNHIEKAVRSGKVKKITGRYDGAIKGAKRDYRNYISGEYGLAIDKCQKAWESTFGEPPITDITPLDTAA